MKGDALNNRFAGIWFILIRSIRCEASPVCTVAEPGKLQQLLHRNAPVVVVVVYFEHICKTRERERENKVVSSSSEDRRLKHVSMESEDKISSSFLLDTRYSEITRISLHCKHL